MTAAGDTHPSIRLTSIESLAANYSGKLLAGELLKDILRRKAQERIVKKVGDKIGETTETILKTVFFFAKAADLRSWQSLPAQIHIVRVPATDGTASSVRFKFTDGAGGSPKEDTPVLAAPGEHCPLALLRVW